MYKNQTLEIGKIHVVLVLVIALLAMLGGMYAYQSAQKDFTTVQGNAYRWQDFKGQWVVVNYFAEWCAPCLREIPELNAFADTAPANVTLLGASYDPLDLAQLQTVIRNHNIGFDVILSTPDTVMPMQKPPYLPSTYVISPSGEVVAHLMGEQTQAELLEKLHALGL